MPTARKTVELRINTQMCPCECDVRQPGICCECLQRHASNGSLVSCMRGQAPRDDALPQGKVRQQPFAQPRLPSAPTNRAVTRARAGAACNHFNTQGTGRRLHESRVSPILRSSLALKRRRCCHRLGSDLSGNGVHRGNIPGKRGKDAPDTEASWRASGVPGASLLVEGERWRSAKSRESERRRGDRRSLWAEGRRPPEGTLNRRTGRERRASAGCGPRIRNRFFPPSRMNSECDERPPSI